MTANDLNTYSTIAQNFIVVGTCVCGVIHFLKKSDILHYVKKLIQVHIHTSEALKKTKILYLELF